MKKQFGRRKTSPFRDTDLVEYLSHDGKETYREEIVTLSELKKELGSGSDPVTGVELKKYAGHVLYIPNAFDNPLGGLLQGYNRIDSRTRSFQGAGMPPAFGGNTLENYQLFEMDQYLRLTAEKNASDNSFLYLQKVPSPQDVFGPNISIDNLFQIHNYENIDLIVRDQGLTAGMDIGFEFDGVMSRFRIDFVLRDNDDIYISLSTLKLDLVNYNKGGLTSEWERNTGEFNINNYLISDEIITSFFLSEVRVLNYVNTLAYELNPPTNGTFEVIDDPSRDTIISTVPDEHISIPAQELVAVQSRDYSHLNLHAPNYAPEIPRFRSTDGLVQLWLIRDSEQVNYWKGYESRAVIPAVVETDYDVLFNKIKSSYVVKK